MFNADLVFESPDTGEASDELLWTEREGLFHLHTSSIFNYNEFQGPFSFVILNLRLKVLRRTTTNHNRNLILQRLGPLALGPFPISNKHQPSLSRYRLIFKLFYCCMFCCCLYMQFGLGWEICCLVWLGSLFMDGISRIRWGKDNWGKAMKCPTLCACYYTFWLYILKRRKISFSHTLLSSCIYSPYMRYVFFILSLSIYWQYIFGQQECFLTSLVGGLILPILFEPVFSIFVCNEDPRYAIMHPVLSSCGACFNVLQ